MEKTLESFVGPTLVIAASVILFGLMAKWMPSYTPDDAYISYEYARNAAEGHGVTFNPGQKPVEGYSNFLWIVACSGLVALGLDLPRAAPYLGFVFGAMTITGVGAILFFNKVSPRQMLLPLLFLATSGPFALYAVSGMEAPLFSFLLVLLVLMADLTTRRYGTWLPQLGLALAGVGLALTRPEGIVAYPVAIFSLALFSWRGKLKSDRLPIICSILLFTAALIAYHVWRVSYYQEWLPTPFLSKAGGGGGLFDAWITNLSIYFLIRTDGSALPFGYYYLAAIALAAHGLIARSERNTNAGALILASALVLFYLLLYPNFVDWFPGMRYHAPLIALLVIPLAWIQISSGSSLSGAQQFIRKNLLSATFIVAVLALNVGYAANLVASTSPYRIGFNVAVIPLAQWLRDSVPKESLLAVSSVGVLPYISELPTLDIHREALTDIHIAKHGLSTEYFYQRSPDIVLLFSRGTTELNIIYPQYIEIVEDPRFQENYRLLGITRVDWRDEPSIWTYAKRDMEIREQDILTLPKGVQLAGKK